MSKIKMTLAVCAALLAMSVFLVGCGKKDQSSSSSSNSSNASSSQTNSQLNSDVTAPDDNGSSNSSSSLGTSSDASKEDHPIASALEDAVEGVYNDLMNGADNWLDKMDGETMKTAYDMDFSNFDEYYGRIPRTNVHASSVIGVKIKDGKKAEARAELMKYQAAMEKNFEKYLPEQYDIVKDYRIIEKGDYMVLVIADNADDIETAFGDAFDKMK